MGKKKKKGFKNAVRVRLPYNGKYATVAERETEESKELPASKVDAPYEVIPGVTLTKEMYRGLVDCGIPIAETGRCVCTRCKRRVKSTTKVKFTIRAFETYVHKYAFCDDCMMYYSAFIENIAGTDDADKIATLLKAEYHRKAVDTKPWDRVRSI